ncbi:MAG TPA: hypothetical protein V6D17_07495, partial [Candidatus Obscuribacterales bacterium]
MTVVLACMLLFAGFESLVTAQSGRHDSAPKSNRNGEAQAQILSGQRLVLPQTQPCVGGEAVQPQTQAPVARGFVLPQRQPYDGGEAVQPPTQAPVARGF